ncbi:DUF6489 family protein [Sphingomonas soli]|uniref:DUF6489 family protein n=1 Tax=Sphingomonas soli TaxID=266127 RepID=UPI000834A0BD|nr:DUF6489 family protein [Sphingomonas soli]
MKINVEVDCTPEEARRFIGLPDLTPVHDAYVKVMMEAVQQQTNPEAFQQLVQSWSPMGDAGMNFWKGLFEAGAKPGK